MIHPIAIPRAPADVGRSSGQIAINQLEPRTWQLTAFDAVSRFRFVVCVCGRRSGKSWFALVCAILTAINKPGATVVFISASIKQSRGIAWRTAKQLTEGLPGVVFKEASSAIEFSNGSQIILASGEDVERLRGFSLTMAICDEIAIWGDPKSAFEDVIRPALADQMGQAIFLSTPRGFDYLHALYERGEDDAFPDWHSMRVSSFEPGNLPASEIATIKLQTGQNTLLREYYARFDASAEDQLIPASLMEVARKDRNFFSESQDVRIIGVDPARFGVDRSVVQRRVGLALLPPIAFEEPLDTMELARRVEQEHKDFSADAIFVDATGVGAGVADRLREQGLPVHDVDFGRGSPDPTNFVNFKSWLFWQLRQAFETRRLYVPDDKTLIGELLSLKYSYDENGRMAIESKKAIKKRGLRSPDLADAAALCWAAYVYPDRLESTPWSAAAEERHRRFQTDWDPYKDL